MNKTQKRPITAYDLAELSTRLDLRSKNMIIAIHPKEEAHYWLILIHDWDNIDDLKLTKDTTIEVVEAWLESIIKELEDEDEAEAEHNKDLKRGDRYI